MNSAETPLDPAVFGGDSIKLFRIAAQKYANLTGIGASRTPGRWNRPGQRAIYTSVEAGTAVCERLAHTPKDRLPRDLAIMTIILRFNLRRPPKSVDVDGATITPLTIYYTAAEALEAINSSDPINAPVAMAVPSVIVPAWNVVLYPQAKGFWRHVAVESINPFDYDPRLFPPDALPESS